MELYSEIIDCTFSLLEWKRTCLTFLKWEHYLSVCKVADVEGIPFSLFFVRNLAFTILGTDEEGTTYRRTTRRDWPSKSTAMLWSCRPLLFRRASGRATWWSRRLARVKFALRIIYIFQKGNYNKYIYRYKFFIVLRNAFRDCDDLSVRRVRIIEVRRVAVDNFGRCDDETASLLTRARF